MSAPELEEGPIAVLDPESESKLGAALRAAYAPSEIDLAQHERILGIALEDPLAPASEEEIAESARLRDALEGRGDHPDAGLARALFAATRPAELDRAAAERAARASLGPATRSNLFFVSFGAAAAIAAFAAAAALVLLPASGRAPSSAIAAQSLVPSRSTAPLFSQKFETSRSTERLSRIASARERDLRANRYAQWGVR